MQTNETRYGGDYQHTIRRALCAKLEMLVSALIRLVGKQVPPESSDEAMKTLNQGGIPAREPRVSIYLNRLPAKLRAM